MAMLETIHWHTLHSRYLGPESTVLDLGANHGQFASAVTDRFGCHCVAVEPSPGPFATIPTTPLITKLAAAVSDKSGIMPFNVSSDSVASSLLDVANRTNTIDVCAFSLVDLLDHLGWQRVDLLKVDVEGAEIGMLAACPDEVLRRVAQISIEFHDFCGITPAEDVHRTLERLHDLGFFSVRMSRVGHQDTWLINRRLLDVGRLELLYIRHVVRNIKGLQRVLARQLKRVSGRV
jgi:FkbM family methyltransferase